MTNLKDAISTLRKIATDAAGSYGDRGWKFRCHGEEDYPQTVYVDGPNALVCDVYEGGGYPAIAKHISCFDPPTIHGLLDEIEELRAELPHSRRTQGPLVTTTQFDQIVKELRAIRAAMERLSPKVDPNQVRRELPDGRILSYPRLPTSDPGFVNVTVPQKDGGPDVIYQIARERLVDPIPVNYPPDPDRTAF